MRRLGAFALAVALACGHPRPPSTPAPAAAPPAPPPSPAPSPAPPSTLQQLLDSDMAPQAGMPWSRERRLAWGDFQGEPPPGGPEAARAAYGLYYGWKCRGPTFEFRVTAAFLPHGSWVKAETLRDTAESRLTLRHEQTHFDVSEVYARRMRREFAQLERPCNRSDAELTTLAQRFVSDEKAMQGRYDDETQHGLNTPKQAEWERRIAQQLVTLSRYAQ